MLAQLVKIVIGKKPKQYVSQLFTQIFVKSISIHFRVGQRTAQGARDGSVVKVFAV